MLLDVNGTLYTAHFKHRVQEWSRDPKPGKERIIEWRESTKCVFHAGKCTVPNCAMNGNGMPDGNGKTFSVAVAVCNPSDQFSKAQGRIRAFTKALNLFCLHNVELSDDGTWAGRCREFRIGIWAAYFKISPNK